MTLIGGRMFAVLGGNPLQRRGAKHLFSISLIGY